MNYEDDFFRSGGAEEPNRPSLLDELRGSSDDETGDTHQQQQLHHHDEKENEEDEHPQQIPVFHYAPASGANLLPQSKKLAAALMPHVQTYNGEDSDEEEEYEEEYEEEEFEEEEEEPSHGLSHADLLEIIKEKLQQKQLQHQQKGDGAAVSGGPQSAAATVDSNSLEADLAELLKQDDEIAAVAKQIQLEKEKEKEKAAAAAASASRASRAGTAVRIPPNATARPPGSRPPRGLYPPSAFFPGVPNPQPRRMMKNGWYADYEAGMYGAPFPPEFAMFHHQHHHHHFGHNPYELPPGGFPMGGPSGSRSRNNNMPGLPPGHNHLQLAFPPPPPPSTNNSKAPQSAAPMSGGATGQLNEAALLAKIMSSRPLPPGRGGPSKLIELRRKQTLQERLLEDLLRLCHEANGSGNTKLEEAGIGKVIELQRQVVEKAKAKVRDATEREMRDEVQRRIQELSMSAGFPPIDPRNPFLLQPPVNMGTPSRDNSMFVPNANAQPFTPPPMSDGDQSPTRQDALAEGLLLSPNNKTQQQPSPPAGLSYLAAVNSHPPPQPMSSPPPAGSNTSIEQFSATKPSPHPKFFDIPSLPGTNSSPAVVQGVNSTYFTKMVEYPPNSYLAKLASKPITRNSPPNKSDSGHGEAPESHAADHHHHSPPTPFVYADLPSLDPNVVSGAATNSPQLNANADSPSGGHMSYLDLARSAASKVPRTAPLKKALTLSAGDGGISLAALEATIQQQKEAAHLQSIPSSSGRGKPDVQQVIVDIDPTTTPVAYVEFKRSRIGKFPSVKVIEPGNYVIVTGDRGLDCGLLVQMTAPTRGGVSVMTMEGTHIDEENIKVEPNTQIIRLADDKEVEMMHDTIPELERVALRSCRDCCKTLRLGIDILDCEYQFDKKKVSFYYYSSATIDFRDLVKALYKVFSARIWMENVNPELKDAGPPRRRKQKRDAALEMAAAAAAAAARHRPN